MKGKGISALPGPFFGRRKCMRIITKSRYGEQAYEVVDRIPEGYKVWSIGDNMGTDDYIPLCVTSKEPGKEFNIIPEKLKAIRLPKDWVFTLRKAAGLGYSSYKATKKLRRAPNRLADKALKIYKTISEGYVPESDYIPEGSYDYEIVVKSTEDGRRITLNQRHKIAEEDSYTIHRLVSDYDGSYVYEVSFLEKYGTVLSTVYLDEPTFLFVIGESVEDFLHGDIGSRLSEVFTKTSGRFEGAENGVSVKQRVYDYVRDNFTVDVDGMHLVDSVADYVSKIKSREEAINALTKLLEGIGFTEKDAEKALRGDL